MNLGFICYRLGNWPGGTIALIPEVGMRIGVTLLVLGAMHFFNMLMIARMGQTVNHWLREQGLRGAEHAASGMQQSQP